MSSLAYEMYLVRCDSNVDPERTVSLLSDLKIKKRNRLSSTCINGTCVFKSALKAREETVLQMKINVQHLYFMSADNLYT